MPTTRKKIKGTVNHYITNQGEVYKGDKKISQYMHSNGSKLCNISGRTYHVGLLVAKHFLKQNPDKMHLTYKDGNRSNVEKKNLSWSYQQFFSKETIERRKKTFLKYRGKKHWKSRPFRAEGRVFHTLREASAGLGTIIPTVQKRLENEQRKDYFYI